MSAPWGAVVSEDGRKLYFDHDREFRAALAEFAGEEVEVILRPKRRPPSQRARGYYYAAIIARLVNEDGYATVDEAHDALVHGILAPSWAKSRPSTSDAAMTSEEFEAFVERACAVFAVERGWVIDDPEPDPVRRHERRLKGRAA